MGTRSLRRLVIVGNGMVSHGLCDALTAPGAPRTHAITVLGEEAVPAYDRVRLAEHSGDAPRLLAPRTWYAERGIELRTSARVASIERGLCSVSLASGELVPYDALVLATGARPRLPSCPGLDAPGVLSYRNFDDVQAIRRLAAGARRALVVGGGLLGLEAAKLLLDAGLEVGVVEASRQLMPRQLDADSAQHLQARVQALGVELHLGAPPSAIRARDGALSLELSAGPALDAELIVLAIGVVPRDELAVAAGLAVGARGGVRVDDELRTTDPRIYAIGDCASHRGRSYGLIGPGLAMAQTVASNLQGKRARFARADCACELKVLGVPVSAVGDYAREARVVAATVPDGRRNLLLESGRLVGATAVGAWPELARVRHLAERRARISERRVARFERTGQLLAQPDRGVAAWPDAAVVCNCRRIDKRRVLRALPAAGGELEALCRESGAGLVCGACRPQLAQLLGVRAPEPTAQHPRWLLGLGFAVLLVCAGWLVRPLQQAVDSVQDPLHALDTVRFNRGYRKLTGFGLLAAAGCSFVLSLRKRTGWLKRPSFAKARVVHGGLGLVSLLGLVAHTGLEAGANLNRLLLTCFLGAGLAGGLAAAAAALEGADAAALSEPARRARRPIALVHLLWLWPLPALLGAHVFAAYYF